jgi:hypothetical protein
LFNHYEAKLDLQVRALEQQLEEERANQGHASEEITHEAKQWLAGLQHSVSRPPFLRFVPYLPNDDQ